MVTNNVITMMFLFNQKSNVADAITLLVNQMSAEEMAEVKSYISIGSFLKAYES